MELITDWAEKKHVLLKYAIEKLMPANLFYIRIIRMSPYVQLTALTWFCHQKHRLPYHKKTISEKMLWKYFLPLKH
jgi:hypothetical protein